MTAQPAELQPAGTGRRRADPALLLLCAAVLVYYCLTPGIFQGKSSGDGHLGLQYLPGIFFHHSLDLGLAAPEYVHVFGRERTGRVANPCPIGPVLLWTPPYLVGLAVKQAAGALAAWGLLPPGALPRHFPPWQPLSAAGPFDAWMAGLGALCAGLVGVAILFRLLRRHLPLASARAGTCAAVLGTPLCWYLVTQPLYQHATAFFAVTLFIERWDAWRGGMTLRRYAALGALGALMMLMRIQEGLFLLLPALDIVEGAARQVRAQGAGALPRWIARGALLCAVAALCFLPQLLVWRHFYGALRPAQPPGHMRWDSPALVETLFSLRAGLLPWTPLLYLALPGLALGRRHLGGLAWRLALLLALELYVNASAWDYHGSWAFGARRFTDAAVTFAAGIGGLHGALGRRGRALLTAALALLVAWNGALMELLRTRRIKNSAVAAVPLSTWVRWARGPRWMERAAARVGYPFAWPATLAYGLLYRAAPTHFEGILGNFLLERDWRVRGVVLTPHLTFSEENSYTVEGLRLPPGGLPEGTPVPAGPRVRLLIPLAAREPLRLHLAGDLGGREGQVEVAWNGERLPLLPPLAPGMVRVEVPERLVRTRARLNELVFSHLPEGARLERVEFRSRTEWWKGKR